MASVGQVSAHAPHDTQAESRKPCVEPGGDVRVEAAAGGGERERALDLVARAHAAPAGDAQLVLEAEVRVALVVVASCVDAPGQRGSVDVRASRATCASSVCGAGGTGSSESTSSTTCAGDAPRGLVVRVDDHAVAAAASCTRATGPGAPSTPTRHTRQAPNGAWRSSKQSVGIVAPAGSRGLEDRRARRRPRSRRRSSTLIVLSEPQLLREVRRAGCGSAPACRRRGRTGCRARASPAAPRARSAIDGRVVREHLVRPAQADPAREALAAALGGAEVQQVAGDLAHVGVRRRRRRSPPWPTMQPSAASGVEVERPCRASRPGRMPPSGPPICSALIVRPSRMPPARSSHSSRIVIPNGHLVDAGLHEALVEADELGAGRRARAERR